VKIVAGLGNPGREYRGTRHNVGFDVLDLLAARHGTAFDGAPVDALVARWRAEGDVVLLAKPLTYMNLSGEAVGSLARYYKVEVPDLLIVCDDVNLPLGRLRARGSGTEGGHNGLRSVAQHLGTIDYARLRVGVGRGDARRELKDYVLARFDADEHADVEALVARAADAVEMWAMRGLEPMMNLFNRAEEQSGEEPR